MQAASVVLNSALEYHAYGWKVLDLPLGAKKPPQKDWPEVDYSADEIREKFSTPKNVGIILGKPSGGLIDIDLDAPEARRIAALFLPETPAVFGRKSSPQSHRLYTVDEIPKTSKYYDPANRNNAGKAVLVELRGNGAQTIFPPSQHLSGEIISWEFTDHTPAQVNVSDLIRRVKMLSAASLLARHWPEGARHEATGALAGGLARSGWSQEATELFTRAVFIAAGDEEARDRQVFIVDTFAALRQGEITTGWPRLQELMPGELIDTVCNWLGIRRRNAGALFPLTDMGNAERFAARHGDDILWCQATNKWYIWNNAFWEPDTTNQIYQRAKEAIRAIPDEAKEVLDPEERKKIFMWAIRSEDSKHLNATVDVAAKTIPNIQTTIDQLDGNTLMLNCLNGTIDLIKGELVQHAKENYLTQCCPVEYDPSAQFEVWREFLREITQGDSEYEEFLQIAFGYSLLGNPEEIAFFPYGPTATGKSTLLEAVKSTLGPYAATADFSTFLTNHGRNTPKTDIARLADKRIVASVETTEGEQLAQGLFKWLTGGDTITARFLYKEEFEFRPKFTLWLASNHSPSVHVDDDALWRRIKRLPFDYSIPVDKRDPRIKQVLSNTKLAGPAILKWIVDGAIKYQQAGKLVFPEKVKASTTEYRSESNQVAQFISETCEFEPTGFVSKAELRAMYETWCDDNGIIPIRTRGRNAQWARSLEVLGIKDDRKTVDMRLVAVWTGVKAK